MKARKNIFLKTAFYGPTKDKYIADQTSSTKPVEAASAVKSSAVGIQLGCNFVVIRSAEACDDQLIIVGTIQATLPCDLETFRCRLIWLGMLALDKTEHKSRSPNRAFPKWVAQSQVLDGHFAMINLVTFNGKALRALAEQFLALAEAQSSTMPLMIGHRVMGHSGLFTGDLAESRAH